MSTTNVTTPPQKTGGPHWSVPAGLILLSLIPVLAGTGRVSELASGAVETAQNARFLESPLPVLIHIVGASIFTLLGAFQFASSPQRQSSVWHRRRGIILIPTALGTALSGLWMTVFYPHATGDGDLLLALRLVFGFSLLASIAVAVHAITQRNFALHVQWMTRAYAIAAGAGTQAIVLIPESILFGPTNELTRALFMGGAWLINLAVAEVVLHRRSRQLRRQKAMTATTSSLTVSSSRSAET